MARGTLFLLGGINDVVIVGKIWRWAFATAGLPHAVEVLRWQQGFVATLTFADLWRTAHHHATADRLVKRVREVREQRPGEPIHVVAHSAGTAITAYALAQLGEAEAVTSAIFVGSGLSSRFDLSAALAGTRVGILSVESYLDAFFLGVGTCLLGSADRRWGPAAGMVGFRPPRDPAAAAKLVRVRWGPRFVRQGWVGGHLSIASPAFVRGTLVPWVRQAKAPADGG